jgi:RecB family exonuclease
METVDDNGSAARLLGRLDSGKLIALRDTLDAVLETRGKERGTELVTPPAADLTTARKAAIQNTAIEALGAVLSPTQVRTYLDCPARWWFKYGLGLPEPKTSWLAFGLAIHSALELNFRYRIETGGYLPPQSAALVFRHAWMEQRGETEFREDEDPEATGRMGERLIALYIEEVAPHIEPAAVEVDVQGEIAGVAVAGRVDLLDREGRLVDIKTAARRPACVSSDYAFQLATYRQITPGASGEARLDTLVKTQRPQIVEHSYQIGEQDLRATTTLFPLVQEGMRSGLYHPNRQSMLCSRRHCPFWRECEQEFGGTVREA